MRCSGGPRTAVTITDEEFAIVSMNDLPLAHSADRGGAALIGTDACHNAESQANLREMYARYRAGDLTPTQYHRDRGDGTAHTFVHIPLVVDGAFRGVAGISRVERAELEVEA